MKNVVEKRTGQFAEHRKLFQVIFEQAAVGVALVSTSSGRFLKINKKYCDILGYSEEEMLNMDFQAITYHEDRKSDFEIIELLKSGNIREFSKEKRFIHKNGDIVWVNLTVSPMWDPGMQPSYHISVVQDITQRKHTEEKLIESEERFKSIFDHARDGILVCDIETKNFFFGNRMISEMLGVDETELKNMNISDIHQEKDLPYVLEQFENQARKEIGCAKDIPMKRKDGSIFYVDIDSTLLTLENRPYLLGIFRDITKRKEWEDKLAKTNAMLIKAQEIGQMGSWEWDLATNDLAWSEEVYKIYGLDPRMVNPKYELILNTLSPECKNDFLKAIDDALEKRKPLDCEYTLICPDGTRTYAHTKGEVVFNKEGHPIKMFGMIQDITKSKQAEKNLKEATLKAFSEKNKSEAIIAALGDGIIIQDTNYKITYQNHIQTEIYGEHAGEHCYKVYGKRDAICEDCPVERTFRDGKIHKSQRSVSINGQMSYYELTSSPLKDSSGKIIAGVKTVRDISGLKRMEQTLRENEAKYRRLVETLMEGIWVLDKDAKTTFVNPRMAQMLGFTVDEMLGKHLFFFMDVQGKKNAARYLERRAQNIREQHDFEFIRKDGKKIYTSLETSPIIDENGNYSGAIAAVADITERKHAEEALRKGEQFLEDIFESIQDGIGIIDMEMNIISVNKTAESWYPHALPLIGKKCYQAYHNREDRCEQCPAQETFRTGNCANKIVPKHGQGGKEVGWLEIYSYPLMDTSMGQMNGVIEYVRDITQKRLAEAERMRLIESEQKALAEVESARKLDRMKSMFIASTSHELRTPLNSIIGFSSLLCDGMSGELNPEQKEQIGLVLSSGKHLLSLISDIIDVSKIESGSIDIKVSKFDLRDVVDEVIRTLQPGIKEKRLDVSVEMEDIPMRSDRRRLLQCIMNLIGNSVKYTEKGSIRISAKTIGNKVDISVTDTGIGIKMQDIPKLFMPFSRLESPLTLKTSGTGLGLYLTKKLARDVLGGDLDAKSEYGKGSTFILNLPVEIQK